MKDVRIELLLNSHVNDYEMKSICRKNFVFYRLIERIRPCTFIIQRKCPFTVRLRRRKHTQTLRGYELSSDCSVWNHRNKEYFTWQFKFDVSFLVIFHSQSRGVHNKWNYYRSKKKHIDFFFLYAHIWVTNVISEQLKRHSTMQHSLESNPKI